MELNNLNSKEARKVTEELNEDSGLSLNKIENPVKNQKSKFRVEKITTEKKEKIHFAKPSIEVPSPLGVDLEGIDVAESQGIRKISAALDEKIKINGNFCKNIPTEVDVTEEDIIKILENYNEDMKLISMITTKASKTMAKVLSKTNKLYNKWVEVEAESIKVEKEILKMGNTLDEIITIAKK